MNMINPFRGECFKVKKKIDLIFCLIAFSLFYIDNHSGEFFVFLVGGLYIELFSNRF